MKIGMTMTDLGEFNVTLIFEFQVFPWLSEIFNWKIATCWSGTKSAIWKIKALVVVIVWLELIEETVSKESIIVMYWSVDERTKFKFWELPPPRLKRSTSKLTVSL